MGFQNDYLKKRMSLLGSFTFFGIIATFAALAAFTAALCVVAATFTTAVMVAMSTATGREKSKRNDSEN